MLTLLFWALVGSSCKHVLGPNPRLPFSCEAHNTGKAFQAPSITLTTEQPVLHSWFVSSVQTAQPLLKRWQNTRSEARKLKCEDPERNGTWEHTVSRGQRLYENTRSWGMSRTRLGTVRATATAFWTYSLNHLAMYYHAQLNTDIFALKLFCQQPKPGLRSPAGLWQVWGARPPTAAAQQPLGSASSLLHLRCKSLTAELRAVEATSPPPLHWMKHLHFWCHIQATTRPIFINSDLVMMFTVTQKYKGCAPLGAGSAAEVQL